ncbi:MAG: ATP-binding protein [Candidatus Aenigmarchaeota archaeon]|nr:ATP-binding protein [Candidatus Aenigmarchaeota archaeon]
MNKFIQFINREKELEFLESQSKKPAPLTVIYGRRRVGKSEIIKHFIKNKKAIYLLATQEVEKELIGSFSTDIAEHFNDSALKANPFSQFKQIAEYLRGKEIAGLTLVIDEFPYLVDANKAVPSILQKYWDMYFKSMGLHIILCGSSVGSMETEVLGRKTPLYGRRTGQWKVDPLPFREFVKFFPDTGFAKLVEFYSITGGIPLYILEFEGTKTACENARSAIATRGSLLYQETEIILKEELREPRIYFSILKEIAAGKGTLNELSNALGVERTALTRYLNTLERLELIELVKPITAKKKSRNTIYSLKDNYFKFWFGFVYAFIKDLDSFLFEGFERNFRQTFNSYVGRQFEAVCREAVRLANPIGSANVGKWWGAYRDTETGERKTAEIDIVSLNEQTKDILLVECKWRDNVDSGKLLAGLREKAKLVQWNNGTRKEYYAIFAKSFRERVKEPNLLLFDLADLEEMVKAPQSSR